jgi:hypothetical protein
LDARSWNRNAQECKYVTLKDAIFTVGGGHGNEVDTEAFMISRLTCKLGNPQ